MRRESCAEQIRRETCARLVIFLFHLSYLILFKSVDQYRPNLCGGVGVFRASFKILVGFEKTTLIQIPCGIYRGYIYVYSNVCFVPAYFSYCLLELFVFFLF